MRSFCTNSYRLYKTFENMRLQVSMLPTYFVVLLGTVFFLTQASCTKSQAWLQFESPEAVGFSSLKLELARQFADSMSSGAVMVIYQGHVVSAWGDIERKFRMHSVRKSLLSALYGIGVEEDVIDLHTQLEDLDIAGFDLLTQSESQASLRDLISSRSGVYLPAAYAPDNQDRNRPPRGSHPPGTHWFYNNWDFNVAGVIYEHETGRDLYTAFDEAIAKPLGMEDFGVSDGFRVIEPGLSPHPAHTFRMSTRDLARFGQLFLQQGEWNGQQIISEEWVDESTKQISDLGDGQGYAYMWWTVEAGSYEKRFPGRFSNVAQYDIYLGRGSGGQGVVVIPDLDMVFVHRGDTDQGRGVGGATPLAVLDKILAAKEGELQLNPGLKPVEAIPFSSQNPAYEEPPFTSFPPSHYKPFLGEYELGPDAIARVFMFEDRPFMYVPGEGEAELFAISETTFTIRVVSNVDIEFETGEQGQVVAVNLALGSRQMRAVKRQG